MKLIAAVPAGFCHGHVKNELPNFRQRKSPDVIAHSRIGSVVRDIPSSHSFGGRAVSYHTPGDHAGLQHEIDKSVAVTLHQQRVLFLHIAEIVILRLCCR
jgi:hypothetical protein